MNRGIVWTTQNPFRDTKIWVSRRGFFYLTENRLSQSCVKGIQKKEYRREYFPRNKKMDDILASRRPLFKDCLTTISCVYKNICCFTVKQKRIMIKIYAKCRNASRQAGSRKDAGLDGYNHTAKKRG